MFNSRMVATLVLGGTLAVALVLVINRGGLIAWSVFAASGFLLAKVWLKSTDVDLRLSIGLALGFGLIWFGTFYYVITTYESGEVVELAIETNEGTHTARLWIFDDGEEPVVYYDTPPEVADALLGGAPLQLTRNGLVSTRIPRAVKADTITEEKANQLFAAMGSKYGGRMIGADVYYLLLGRPRDRVALVVYLSEDQ